MDKIQFFTFDQLNRNKEIIHFVTTRTGGVSKGAYASLNIGFGTEDEGLSVLANRHHMAASAGIPLDYFVMAHQVHATHVEIVTKNRRGAGAFHRYNALKETDAMITNQPEICLFVMAADCVPLLFFDPVTKVIGAAHAGWRGTVAKIAAATVKRMTETYGCNLSDIQAGVGPSIGPCCYQVGTEVTEAVMQAFGTSEGFLLHKGSQTIFDLWYANKKQLLEAGLKEENIEVAQLCTLCHHDRFFSSRHGKGITGRFGAGIMLK